ncbi:STAS domain-containing protein [Streptomyces sp. NPDC049040]|uniref:STAS domain-containing protein n=1 Tax=Streptomyces sp. NPDC049040 TaxID=3365593 RepID=UPI003710C393
MARLDIHAAYRDGTLTVTIAGEIDLDSAPQVYQAVQAADAPWGTHVVADLSGVTFMDSTGVRMLLACYEHAQEHGGTLSVTGVHDLVERILYLSGVLSLFRPPPPGSTRPGLN